MAHRSDLMSMQDRLRYYEIDLERAIDENNSSEIRRLTRLIESLKNEINGILREIESER